MQWNCFIFIANWYKMYCQITTQHFNYLVQNVILSVFLQELWQFIVNLKALEYQTNIFIYLKQNVILHVFFQEY